VINSLDNCPLVKNPKQRDRNHNGIGDACELKRASLTSLRDLDGNGTTDLIVRSSTATSANYFSIDSGQVSDLSFGGNSVCSDRKALIRVGDFDGDGRSDAACVSHVAGRNLNWSVGSSILGASIPDFIFGQKGDLVLTCDTDQDGISEVLSIHRSHAARGVVVDIRDIRSGSIRELLLPNIRSAKQIKGITCDSLSVDNAFASLIMVTKLNSSAGMQLRQYSTLDGTLISSSRVSDKFAGVVTAALDVDSDKQIGIIGKPQAKLQKISFSTADGRQSFVLDAGTQFGAGTFDTADGRVCDGVLYKNRKREAMAYTFCDKSSRKIIDLKTLGRRVDLITATDGN